MILKNIDQVLQEYRKASNLVENVLGIRFPEPDITHLVDSKKGSPLAPREDPLVASLGLLGEPMPQLGAGVSVTEILDGSLLLELYVPNDTPVDTSILVHEGAHIFHYRNNPRIINEKKKHIPTKKLLEGFASRVEQYVWKSQSHSMLEKFGYYFEEFHDTLFFDEYHGYRNFFAKISNWEKELEIAMTCVNDIELKKAISKYRKRK